jgi:hypothetical protein
MSHGIPSLPSGWEVVNVKPVLPDFRSASTCLIFPVVLILLLVPQGALAHPPTDVQASSDANGILSVTITHPVGNPLTHYIKRVLVTAGGSTIIENVYTSQPAEGTFTYTYTLPPGVSGELRVTADCSIAGSRSSAILIPAGTTVPAASIPAATGTASLQTATEPGLPATTAAGTAPAAPGTTPTKAGAGLFPIAAAAALAVWRFRR